MKQIVAYKLVDGQIPAFIFDGGYYPKDDFLVGISTDDASLPDDVTVFNTKNELKNYFKSYSNTWVSDTHISGIPLPTVDQAVDSIWLKLN